MQLSIILEYLPYALVTNFTPGPNNILELNSAKSYGLKKSRNVLLGICTGFTCIMFLCGILCISLSQISDVYQSRMKYVGAVYLLWLAWHIFISKPDAKSEVMSKKPSFMSGFIVQFVNVKVMLYGMVSITSFVFPYTKSKLIVFLFVIGMSILGALAALTWAFAGSIFQKFLNNHYRIVNTVMALILLKSAFDLIF